MAYQSTGNSQNRQFNDILEPVCQFGFTFNHIFTVALIHRVAKIQSVKENLREKYMFFLTIAPGEGQANQRTYNFKNKITLKYSIRETISFANVLLEVGRGNDSILPYRKFSRTQTESKNCGIWTVFNKDQQGQQVKSINITFSSVQKYSIVLTPSDAIGIGEVIRTMTQKGLELEINHQMNSPKGNSNSTNYQQSPTIFTTPGNGDFDTPGAFRNFFENYDQYPQPLTNNPNNQTPNNLNLGQNVAPPTFNPTMINPNIQTNNQTTVNNQNNFAPSESRGSNDLKSKFGQMLTNVSS